MKRQRQEDVASRLRGLLHQIEQAKKSSALSADTLKQIQQSAIDARDVLEMRDPDEQRFWTALLVFSQSAEVYTRKNWGKEVERVRYLDPEGYHWSAAQLLRLAPIMMLRAA